MSYLTANIETFFLKISSYLLKSDIENKRFFYLMLDNYLKSCKNHLRGKQNIESMAEVFPGFKKSLKENSHFPNAIMGIIEKKVIELYRENYLTRVEYLEISKHIDKANTFFDYCDTIRTTKTTKSYIYHIRVFLAIYSLCLPFAFTDQIIEFWMIVALGIIFFSYIECEMMSEEVENPFGSDKNDLPLEQIYNDTQMILNQINHFSK
jgi:putative membrane protein